VAGLFPPDSEHPAVIAEFALVREFMRPIRCFDRFDRDPLAGIIGVLSGLEHDKRGVLQVLFSPVVNPWTDSILRSITDGIGKPFFVKIT
jgi:hypothetical protein